MDTLEIIFVGPVKRPGPSRTLTVDASSYSTVADLLRGLGCYGEDELTRLHVLGDGQRLNNDAPLAGLTRLEILVAIGGG